FFGILTDHVPEQRAGRGLALQRLGSLVDDNSLLLVVLLDRQYADRHGLLAQLRHGQGRKMDVPARGRRNDRRQDHAGDGAKGAKTHGKLLEAERGLSARPRRLAAAPAPRARSAAAAGYL